MKVDVNIEHYFAALERQARQIEARALVPETVPFVTLSRQAGAGGRSVAKALLEAFAEEPDRRLFDGWQVLDRNNVEALQRHHDSKRVRTLLGEDYHTQIGEFVLGLFGRDAPQDTALLRQTELMRSLAVLGRVIIVGHGASQATRGLRSGVHLRLVAPEPARRRRLAEQGGLDEDQVRQEIARRDQARARLLKDHYRVDIDDPLLYNAVFNTGELSVKAVAAATLALVKRRAAGL